MKSLFLFVFLLFLLLLPRGNIFSQGTITFYNNTGYSGVLSLAADNLPDGGGDEVDYSFTVAAGADYVFYLQTAHDALNSTYGDGGAVGSVLTGFTPSGGVYSGTELGQNTYNIPSQSSVLQEGFSSGGVDSGLTVVPEVSSPPFFLMGALCIAMRRRLFRRWQLPLSVVLIKRLRSRWRLVAFSSFIGRCVGRLWLGLSRENIRTLISGGFRIIINNFDRLGLFLANRIQHTSQVMKVMNRARRLALVGAFIAMGGTVGAFAQTTNVTTDVSVLYSGIVTPFNAALGISLAITGVLLVIWAVRRAIKARA